MREYSPKRLLLCLLLICGFSGTMQILFFGKRQDLHHQHYADQSGQSTQAPVSAPVEGVVAAIGMDRLHLNNGKSTDPYRCENPGQYHIGERLRITYAQGEPPLAVKVERL